MGDTIAAYADMTNARINDLIDRDNAMNRRFDRFINFIAFIAGAVGVIAAGVQIYLAFKE